MESTVARGSTSEETRNTRTRASVRSSGAQSIKASKRPGAGKSTADERAHDLTVCGARQCARPGWQRGWTPGHPRARASWRLGAGARRKAMAVSSCRAQPESAEPKGKLRGSFPRSPAMCRLRSRTGVQHAQQFSVMHSAQRDDAECEFNVRKFSRHSGAFWYAHLLSLLSSRGLRLDLEFSLAP